MLGLAADRNRAVDVLEVALNLFSDCWREAREERPQGFQARGCLCVSVGEDHSLSSQSIDIGRLDEGVTLESILRPTVVITDEEEDVRGPPGRGWGRWSRVPPRVRALSAKSEHEQRRE